MARQNLGVYIHVPFCESICHYCDFAKTANWRSQQASEWITQTAEQLEHWLRNLMEETADYCSIETLFLGGGTPGIFGEELSPFIQAVEPWLAADAELSLEANPDNLHHLQAWKSIGFNRLSVGVQSFQKRGLQKLTRSHNPDAAALAKISDVFTNFSFDLIYGWDSQTLQEWENDLDQALRLHPTHLSLYNLIYEPGTTLGRKYARGVLPPRPDNLESQMYQLACERLAGMEHNEVANWALPGHNCRHNRKYWQGEPVLALGPGACGHLRAEGMPQGLRYRQSKSINRPVSKPQFQNGDLPSVVETAGFEVEARSTADWLVEYIGSGLRTAEGLDLQWIYRVTGQELSANEKVQQALAAGLLVEEASHLRLCQQEWFREVYWCLEVMDSFCTKKRSHS